MKKTYYILIAIFTGLIIGLLYFFLTQNKENEYETIDTIIGVPINSELIIHVPDLKYFLEKSEKNAICEELQSWESIQDFKRNITNVKKFLGASRFYDLVDDAQLTVATKISGRKKVEFSYIFPLKNSSNKEALSEVFEHFFKDFKKTNRHYSGFELYHIKDVAKKQEYFYTFAKGLLIFSTAQIPVEDALLQITNNNSLSAKKSFNRLQKIASASDDLNIFINGRTMPNLIALGVDAKYRRFIKRLTNFTDQAGIDLNFGDDKILLNGFLYTGTDDFNYTNILLNQKPVENTMEEIVPANTAFWAALALSDENMYMDNYKRYMEHTGGIKHYRIFAKTFHQESKQFPEEFIYPYLNSEIGLVISKNKVRDTEPEHYCVLKTKSKSEMQEQLNLLLRQYKKSGRKLAESTKHKIDDKLSYTIYPFPYSRFANMMWGGLFFETETNYCTLVDNYLVFGRTIESVKKYINAIARRKTLKYDDFYQQQKKYWIDNKASFIAYMHNTANRDFLKNMMGEYITTSINEKNEVLNKFPSVGIQLKAIKEMLYVNAYVAYDKQPKKIPQTVWQSRLDNPMRMKPVLVRNHKTNERELLFQDKDNTLYLISNNGHILWKRPMKEKIIGTAHQVDAYKNKKIQYLFNTHTQLHLIDRNGNNVADFPHKLQSPATNPIAVFDYEKTKNYRIFVAGEDKRIYLYDIKGQLIKGWEASPSEHKVAEAVQHFVCSGKDYITFNDGYRNYILNRRGKTRVSPQKNYHKAVNSTTSIAAKTKYQTCKIINTDTLGVIHLIDLAGNITTKKVGEFSVNHSFESNDINSNGRNNYIFVDANKLSVYKSSGKLLFDYEFDTSDIGKPYFYTFSSHNKKIGIRAGERIYLFNSNGTLYDGFPLAGYSDFTIGFVNPDDKDFNLFVAGKGNLLYNYAVK